MMWFKKFPEVDKLFNKSKLNVYLGGPIGKYDSHFNWRSLFKDSDKINYIRPDKWYYQDYNTVCKSDIYAMSKCDFLVFYIPFCSPGTTMELHSLIGSKKRLIVVLKEEYSPWYLYAIKNTHPDSIIVNTIKQCKQIIDEWSK